MECKVCGTASLQRLNTYKHYWYRCRNCGSIERENKSKYIFEFFIPLRFSKKLPSYFSYLLPGKYFDASKLGISYNYYGTMGSTGQGSGTKWEGETQIVIDRLREHGIDLEGKSVLDISGGPGFVANNLSSITSYILLTEYSAQAVEGMKKFLSIDVKKYDYNSDNLDRLTDKKFDVVLVRFSINFCLDLAKFAHGAKNILNPGGIVYIEHVEPNKGCILRWQFDDYTYQLLHGVKIFESVFNKNGFETIKQQILFEEAYNKPYWNYPTLKVKMFYFFIRRIRDGYKLFLRGLKNDLEQKSWVSIFKVK